MNSLNQVLLMGNLTRDPECKKTTSGMVVSELGMAISESFKDKDGKKTDRTCFVDVIVWGKQAEACKQYLKKGSSMLVEGRLQLDQWQTDTGEKRSKIRVNANRIHFLGRAVSNEQAKPDDEKAEAYSGHPF